MAPWTNKTGLARAAAILATMLGVSLGLCAASSAAGISMYEGYWGFRGHTLNTVIIQTLFVGGWFETAGIVAGTLGLIVVGVMALWRTFRGSSSSGAEKGE